MRKYELSNHLGNVLAVVTDRKITYMPGEFCHNSTSGFVQNADGTLSAITSSWGRAGNSTSSTVYNAKVLWRNAGTSLTSETCMVGLSYSPASRFNYIDYAIYLQYGSRYYVYERGRNKTSRSSATYVTGDVPVVERIDGKIYYYIMRDGVRINLRTKTETRPNTPLYLSYDSYRSGATLDLSFQTSEKAHYVADYVSVSDYYPFGMQMQGRTWSAGDGYRFAFNGKEQDNEVSGSGNSYDYGFRIYNPRLGRFLSVDPLTNEYPWNSTYSYAENDVIRSIDLEGLERAIVNYTREKPRSMLVFVNDKNLGFRGPLGNGILAVVDVKKMESKKTYDKASGKLYKGKVKITQFYYAELNESEGRYQYTKPDEVIRAQWIETEYVDIQEINGFRKSVYLFFNRDPEPYGGPTRKVRDAKGSERVTNKILEGKPGEFLKALYSKAGEGSPHTVVFGSGGGPAKNSGTSPESVPLNLRRGTTGTHKDNGGNGTYSNRPNGSTKDFLIFIDQNGDTTHATETYDYDKNYGK